METIRGINRDIYIYTEPMHMCASTCVYPQKQIKIKVEEHDLKNMIESKSE